MSSFISACTDCAWNAVSRAGDIIARGTCSVGEALGSALVNVACATGNAVLDKTCGVASRVLFSEPVINATATCINKGRDLCMLGADRATRGVVRVAATAIPRVIERAYPGNAAALAVGQVASQVALAGEQHAVDFARRLVCPPPIDPAQERRGLLASFKCLILAFLSKVLSFFRSH